MVGQPIITTIKHSPTIGIPTNWNLELRAHNGGECRGLFYTQNHYGSTNACLSGGIITGGGYGFRNVKRNAIAPTEGQCAKPNEVGFADGVRYNLTLLDAAAADKVLEILGTGGVSADVPAEFDIGKIAS